MKNLFPTAKCFLFALCICLIYPGCSKEDMDEMVAKAKDSATEFKDKSSDAFGKAKANAGDAAAKLKDAAGDLKGKTAEAMSSAKDKAKELTSQAGQLTNKATNMMAMNGSANITLDAPTDFPASYVRVIPLAEGKSVLQLKSYAEDGQSTSFPAFFIQGTLTQNSVDALDGQSVSCQLFAQKTDGGDVWQNPIDELVVVSFKKQNNKLTASFGAITLINLTTNNQVISKGTFECVELK